MASSPSPSPSPSPSASPSPSPSPEPCELNGVDPNPVTICVGQQQEFNAEGENLDGVEWSTEPEGSPPMGEGVSFQTQWATPGHKSVTASCCGTSVHADVTVVRVDKVIIDGSEPEDEGPATICFAGSIILRAKPEPAGVSFPEGSPSWEFVENPQGSQLQNPPVGETAQITPDVPGTYKIKATCGTSSKMFTLHTVEVTFAPAHVRMGFTRPVAQSTISCTVVATVEPACAADLVQLEVAGPDRVTLSEPSVDSQAGTITFEVRGKHATPPHSQVGDTRIEARIEAYSCAEVPAVVVVPTRIGQPYPQAVGNVEPHNQPDSCGRRNVSGSGGCVQHATYFARPRRQPSGARLVSVSGRNPPNAPY